jgi:putative PEP-CTERM system histidine kinase
VSRVVVRLTADLFQSLSVGVWLVDDRKEALTQAASTFLSEIKAEEVRPQKNEVVELMGYFQENHQPVDFETPVEPWAELLRRIHPSQFDAAGHRICVPLVARGEVLGLLLIGDRVGGTAFSRQDFDMLQCIGDHVTANLLNVQLSRRLLQAKEFEAFQTMAAFFVHDLKNAASTLNLMLQNLPIHFDDPAFREDALRGMGKSVSHINDLIGRLTALRHELKIALTDSDLNEVVSRTLAALETGPESAVVRNLGSVARVPHDRDQVAKVITNLVINAREATTGQGEIRVTTRQVAGEVVLEVADQGSGMSAEFVRHSLFRPFQTTKKKGLGIGMFQSKMIVEAHGGRITVVTQPGSGSTFQVYFPVPKPGK